MYPQSHTPATAVIRGTIRRVAFRNPSGWAKLVVSDEHGREHMVVGVTDTLAEGAEIEAHGTQETHPKWGDQFKAQAIAIIPPTTEAGLLAYLSSGTIAGIGKAKAKALLAHFGLGLIDVLDHDPQRLREVKGIGATRQARIEAAWTQSRQVRDLIMLLGAHGVSATRAASIHRHFEARSLEIVTRSPYRLTEVRGFGFETADRVALALGVDREAPERIAAGVVHALDRAAVLNGHCALPQSVLERDAAELLGTFAARAGVAIETLVNDEVLVRAPALDEGESPLVYLASLHKAEVAVATGLRAASRTLPPWGDLDASGLTTLAARECGVSLSPSQHKAVCGAIRAKVSVISGGPGTGKTTTTKVLLEALDIATNGQLDVRLCAPTGRAARRLSEATGRPASTIHRLLMLREDSELGDRDTIDADLVLVDEVSMVDLRLMAALVRALPRHAALVLIGDADQLPSVGPGAVFGDIIESRTVPVHWLTEIHRQAQGSSIVQIAHVVRQGRVPEVPRRDADCVVIEREDKAVLAGIVVELVSKRLPAHGFDPLRDIQVLSPMKKGPVGILALNTALQQALNPRPSAFIEYGGQRFGVGDRVLQTRNDREREVYNGDQGLVVAADSEDGVLSVDFDGNTVEYERAALADLQLAFATTVHKSQGSEFPCVVLALAKEHYMLLSRRLVYTALTRGKRQVIIVSEAGAFALGCRDRTERRIGGLVRRLSGRP